jgi:serine/threonine-protein kinase
MTLDAQFGTQYNLALCYEKVGRLASAWGELTELAAKDPNAARKADSDKRARAMEPRLVRLLIVVKERLPSMKIMRDDSDVTAFMGVATPVDPGMSKLTASAPGYKPWSFDVTIAGEGTTITVDVPPLEKSPDPPPPPPGGGGNDVFRTPLPPGPPADPGQGRRKLGLIMGGVGVVGIGAGVVFGLSARSAFARADEECGGDVGDCRGDATSAADAIDAANSSALLSNIGFGVGAAALVGGAVLYLTAPKAAEKAMVSPTIGDDGTAGFVVSGRF